MPDSADSGSVGKVTASSGAVAQPAKPEGDGASSAGATSTGALRHALSSGALAHDRWRRNLYVIWSAIGAIVLLGVVVYLLNVLALPMSMVIWTLVIVFCLRGTVASLEKRGVGRLLGTTIAYIGMFILLGVVLFLMFSPMFGINDQFANLVSSVPSYVDAIMNWLGEMSKQYSSLAENDTVRSMIASAGESISQAASSFASGAANAAVGIGTGVVNTIYALGFALVIAFWILLELPAMGREVKRILSPKYEQTAEFLHITFTRILGGYIKGTLIQCLIIGVACGILFAFVGINDAPALGVITGVLNIIPIIGPWLGGAVAAITAVFASPIKALITLIGVVVIQQFVYTFVSPRIMQNSVDIHPALTLVAMIFGSAIGGAMSGLMGSLVGMLFAIPAVAVIKSVFIFYFEKSTGRQIVDEDGFIFKGKASSGGVDPLYDATAGTARSRSLSEGGDAAD